MLCMSGCTIFGSVTCIIPSSICSSLRPFFFGSKWKKERLGVYFPQVIKRKKLCWLDWSILVAHHPLILSNQHTHPNSIFDQWHVWIKRLCGVLWPPQIGGLWQRIKNLCNFLGWRRVLKIIGNLMGNQKHYHWLKRHHRTRCIQQFFWLVFKTYICALNFKKVDVMEEW